jgi:DNA-binding NarL/FixJ family response regulator
MNLASSPSADLQRVLILKSDRLYADMLRRAVAALVPAAQVIMAHTVCAATYALGKMEVDLLIVGIDPGLDGDVLQLLVDQSTGAGRRRRLFIVGADLEYRVLAALHGMSVRGVFDPSSDSPEEFSVALRTVIRGERYWSRSVLDRLRRDLSGQQSVCQFLSMTEQLVLAVLGDGSDDLTASQALGISPSTVSTFRRKLHRKLRIQHRGELIRVAAQNGFVRFTPSGVVRPGFAMLAAECLARKHKRRATASAAVAAFLHEQAPLAG